MNILITICARGGSKGVPGKNIKSLNGQPLIYFTLNIVKSLLRKAPFKDADVILSTDSLEIKKVVSEFENVDIDLNYIRPISLSTDESGKLDAIIDVKKFISNKKNKLYDYVLDLDVTSPLRTSNDILTAFDILNNTNAHSIFSVSKANKNPYFNMVEQNKNGFYGLSKEGKFLSRQSAPNVYEMNASFYIYKNSFFDLNLLTPITERSLIYEMDHICFDIDHLIDFDFMEYLVTKNKLNFKIE